MTHWNVYSGLYTGKIAAVAAIEGIVNALKSFVEKLEQMSNDAVSEIEKISQSIAGELRTLVPEEFSKVKAHISSLINAFKAKIRSLGRRRIQTNAGTSATSFARHISSSLKAAEREAEQLLHKAKEDASAMVAEVRALVRRLSDTVESARGDVTADIRKAGEDTYNSLVKLGENAVNKMEVLIDDIFKEIELDGSFLWKHSVEIAEAATISAINPFLLCSLAASVALVAAAHSYSESIKKKKN